MVIGRGRRREHLIYENKRGEHLIYENKKGVVSYAHRTRTS